jgi:hypothetical protein
MVILGKIGKSSFILPPRPSAKVELVEKLTKDLQFAALNLAAIGSGRELGKS